MEEEEEQQQEVLVEGVVEEVDVEKKGKHESERGWRGG